MSRLPSYAEGQADGGRFGVPSRGVPRPGGGKADSMPERPDWRFSSGDAMDIRKISNRLIATYHLTPSLSPAVYQ
jgi:hypothetical protein